VRKPKLCGTEAKPQRGQRPGKDSNVLERGRMEGRRKERRGNDEKMRKGEVNQCVRTAFIHAATDRQERGGENGRNWVANHKARKKNAEIWGKGRGNWAWRDKNKKEKRRAGIKGGRDSLLK